MPLKRDVGVKREDSSTADGSAKYCLHSASSQSILPVVFNEDVIRTATWKVQGLSCRRNLFLSFHISMTRFEVIQ